MSAPDVVQWVRASESRAEYKAFYLLVTEHDSGIFTWQVRLLYTCIESGKASTEEEARFMAERSAEYLHDDLTEVHPSETQET